MCNQCEIDHDPENNWDGWDGKIEIHEVYEEHGVVLFVEHERRGKAPYGVETEWAVYGHLKAGGVFWIADFPVTAHSAAVSLAHRLEHAYADSKEIERLTECLENPVGYVNQAVLVDLRENEGGHVGSATVGRTPDSYHNCAIYAQD